MEVAELLSGKLTTYGTPNQIKGWPKVVYIRLLSWESAQNPNFFDFFQFMFKRVHSKTKRKYYSRASNHKTNIFRFVISDLIFNGTILTICQSSITTTPSIKIMDFHVSLYRSEPLTLELR